MLLAARPPDVAQVFDPAGSLVPVRAPAPLHGALVPALAAEAAALSALATRAAGTALASAPLDDAAPLLSHVARRALGAVLFGQDHDAHGSPLPAALDALAAPGAGPASPGRLDFLLQRHVARRRESGEGVDALAALVALHDGDAQVRAESVSLAAGCLAPAEALLEWAVSVTAATPEAAQFLEPAAFVRELLRLYPPAWLQRFTVQRELELCGVRLQPGDEAWTSPFVTQRLESLHPHPDRFDAGRVTSTTAWAFFPFGARDGGAVEWLVVTAVSGALRALSTRLRATAPGSVPPPEAGEVLRAARPLRLVLQRR